MNLHHCINLALKGRLCIQKDICLQYLSVTSFEIFVIYVENIIACIEYPFVTLWTRLERIT